MRHLYRFAGTSRLTAARTRVADALRVWSADWRLDDAVAPLWSGPENPLAGDATPLTAARQIPERVFVAAGKPVLRLGATVADWRKIIFGARPDIPEDAIAGQLLDRAIQSLAAGLCDARDGIAAASLADSTAERSDGSPWISMLAGFGADGEQGMHTEGVLTDHLRADSVVLRLRLSAALFNDALPPSRRPPVTLLPREAAIAPAGVRLRVSLPIANLSAPDLRQLQPGIVIRSPHRLDAPLALEAEGQATGLQAAVGRRGGYKAIHLHPRQRRETA